MVGGDVDVEAPNDEGGFYGAGKRAVGVSAPASAWRESNHGPRALCSLNFGAASMEARDWSKGNSGKRCDWLLVVSVTARSLCEGAGWHVWS